jgi:hypothetical protein
MIHWCDCDKHASPILLHEYRESGKSLKPNHQARIVATDIHAACPDGCGDGGVHFAADRFHSGYFFFVGTAPSLQIGVYNFFLNRPHLFSI